MLRTLISLPRQSEDTENLFVLALRVYDVSKRAHKQRGEGEALRGGRPHMYQGATVGLTASLAISAAHLGIRERLPLADSVILATARAYDATLWTQDADFDGMEGVQYVASRSQRG